VSGGGATFIPLYHPGALLPLFNLIDPLIGISFLKNLAARRFEIGRVASKSRDLGSDRGYRVCECGWGLIRSIVYDKSKFAL
jgi:hypothetical protein